MSNKMSFMAHTPNYSMSFVVVPRDDPSFIDGQDPLEDFQTMMQDDFNRCFGRLNRIMRMSDSDFDDAFGGSDEASEG